MKRMWQNWLAVVALMTLTGTTMAQTGFNQPAEIGSYQSILARAGYDSGVGILGGGAVAQPGVPVQVQQQGAAMYGGSMQGGAMGSGTRGGIVQQGVTVQQGSGTRGGIVEQGGIVQHGGAVMQQGSGTRGGAMIQQGSDFGAMVQGGSGSAVGEVITDGSVMNNSGIGLGGTPEGALPNGPMGVGSGAFGTGAIGSGAIGGSVFSGDFVGGSVMAAPAYSSGPVYSSAPSYSSGPVYSSAPVYSAPQQYVSSPVYQQSVVAPVYTAGRQRARSNYTFGLTGLFFQRDYEDNRLLARNPSGGTLSTNDADDGSFDGYGVNFGSRNAGGGGFEVAYWAFNPGRSIGVLQGMNVATTIQGLDQLLHVSSGRDLLDIYSNTVTQTIVRETDINNLEFNLLRNGGTFSGRKNRTGFYELLGGFRWFQFDESLQYTASIDNGQFPLVPSDFFYNLRTQNTLLGFQLGARNEYCLGSKLRFFSGVKGGIFNNNIRTNQNITDLDGEIAQVNSGAAAGRPFSYDNEKNDLAFLGELDLGFLYHFSSRTRLRVGYRALGVSGVALAADQLPFQYNDPNELLQANSNGSLILGGGYYGLEFCF